MGYNDMERRKKAILVISFGTSYEETRRKTIDAIELDIQAAFPGYEFRRAYTSPTIIRILKNRDGLEIDNVEQALARLAEDGYRVVVAQPTHVIRGYEYDGMMEILERYRSRFDVLECGEPLLGSSTDYHKAARAVGEALSGYRRQGTGILLMGHGTEHVAKESYEKLQQAFFEEGFEDCLVGTIEDSPVMEHMIGMVKKRNPSHVLLAPFLVVAGNHALKDMAGDEETSWKCRFERAGYQVECLLRGLGEYPGIRRMYVEHALAAAGRYEDKDY